MTLMLRPIRKTDCAVALSATQKMIRHFALWLCQPTTQGALITEVGIRALVNTPEEAAWLWSFLGGKHKEKTHLKRSQHLADLPADIKNKLQDWIVLSTNISKYFDLTPTGKLIPVALPLDDTDWKNFKDLMEAFYLKGLKEGLAYLPNGTPTDNKKKGLNYKTFRSNFITLHKIDKHEFAREVCVICNGELRNASIDHWIPKAAYPILSVCADNLVPICSECNQSPNKGSGSVHTDGSFEDWFHPYFRHPDGTLKIAHKTASYAVVLKSTRPSDDKRVENLNSLFNLELRWTREFKGEYRKLYNAILTRQRKKKDCEAFTLESLCQQIRDWADGLSPEQPNFEVHQALADALHDANRLIVWHGDLIKDLE